jgi:PhnB protein
MMTTTTSKPDVRPIPESYHTLTPSLTVHNAAEAIEFYKRAFGAEELYRAQGPDGQQI